ncbi:nucleoporin autopeptidase-domain-containing protein [Chlamydoabsidia padenii]|nr:nucleoporin autopeptidase-domain-containing protein [Chlamydoabsidia padenii]
MFGKSAFGGTGGTGAFGQTQQQPAASPFGQQPQQQSAFGGFGAAANTGGFGAQTTTPSAFGQPAQQTTSAFGQPAQQTTSAFGQPAATTGAFGAAANTGSAFGQRPSAFGSPAPTGFGATQPTATGFGGGGAFGAGATTTTSAFGAPASQATGGIFGQRPATTSAFGASTTPTTNAFGQPQQQTSVFGGGATTSGFGQPAGGMNQGTAVADFAPTTDRDLTTGVNNFFQTITAMPQYKQQSLEELRLQDYNQNRKTGTAQPTTGTGFGAASTGFGSSMGQTSTPFGQSSTTGFGTQQQTGAFGQQQQQQPAFGATQTGGLFGQTQQQPTTGFGQQPATNAFGGSSAFGQQQQQQQPAFGAANTAAKPSFSFGSTPATTGGFGATTGGFGQTPATNSMFGQAGQQPQQQAGGFSFGQKPAGTTGGFGTGFGTGAATGGFGATANKPATSFSFGASAAPATSTPAATGFGGFGTGATTGTTGGFGQTQPAQTGFGAGATGGGLFGAKPATGQTNSLFGNNQQPSTTPSFGGFGGTNQQQPSTGFGTGATGGGLFGAKPAGTGGMFGNTQPATGGFGGFGGFGNQQQQQGAGSFTLPATGGLTSFGTNGLQPGQQPLVATVDKSPYGNNPLFNTSAIQQQQQQQGQQQQGNSTSQSYPSKTGPTAIPADGGKKLTTTPHYPISPRVVSKIKLRGFSFNPNSKPSTKKTSELSGVSDLDILASGAYTPRAYHKKASFDKVDHNKVASLVNTPQTTHASSALFAPNLGIKSSDGQRSRQTTTDGTTSSSESELQSTNNNRGTGDDYRGVKADVAIDEGYYCSPTLEVLKSMTPAELKKVDNFVVGRKGCGEVKFESPVDLSEVNLDKIMGGFVFIDWKSVAVYPHMPDKPAFGVALNVPAIVTLERCFTTDKATKQTITDPAHPRFKTFMDKLRTKPNTTFIDYDVHTGVWKFKVDSF